MTQPRTPARRLVSADTATVPKSGRGPLKVVYIGGFARSGSTLLGNMLGEMDGFLHVGELRYLLSQAVRRRGKCGCGRPMVDCEFWTRVLDRTYGEQSQPYSAAGDTRPDRSEILKRAWNIERAALATSWRERFTGVVGAADALHLRHVAALFESLRQLSGARVIVDSSKRPGSGRHLAQLSGLQPYYLHLVRDSRGAVLSRQRRRAKRKGDHYLLNPVTSTADCLRWTVSNFAAEALPKRAREARRRVVRYEDFIARPADVLSGILEWLGEGSERLPLIDGTTAILGPNHTVCGNRNRFQTGEVRLRLDDMWRRALRRRDYLMITALTAPGLIRYGYSLRRHSAPSGDRA